MSVTENGSTASGGDGTESLNSKDHMINLAKAFFLECSQVLIFTEDAIMLQNNCIVRHQDLPSLASLFSLDRDTAIKQGILFEGRRYEVCT